MEEKTKKRPSGLEWIKDIPFDWECTKVKFFYKYQAGGTPDTTNMEFYDGDNKWVTIGDMNKKFINDTTTKLTDKGIREVNIKISEKGSLLFSFKLSIGKVAICDEDLYTNEAIITINYKNCSNDIGYLYYAMPIFVTENANTNIYGAKLLNKELIQNAKIFIPPIQEQKKIAEFLNVKCNEIDRVISVLESQVKTLNKLKKSIIIETISIGLNKNVEFKSSDTDYSKKCPKHWIRTRVKFLCDMRSGSAITAEEIEDSGKYLVYGGNGIRGYYSQYTNCGENVLIGRQGALCGNVHYAKGKYWASDHAIVTYNYSNVDNKFLYYLFNAMNLNQYSQSAAQPGLAVSTIQRLNVCVPETIMEQRDIVEYLDKKISAIDVLIENKLNSIKTIVEYEKSLIFEYVTGKKRV